MKLTSTPHLRRHNVSVTGTGDRDLLLVHGYGCDQSMWQRLVPYLAPDYRVYLFDHVGTRAVGREGWDPEAYADLGRYAEDVRDVVTDLDLRDVTLVGHSVSAMICGLAAAQLGDRVRGVVMIGPSPRYLNLDDGYAGGFSRADLDGLIASIESNYFGWSQAMAPAIMGRPDAPEYGGELTDAFCRQDPEVAAVFSRATFLSDNRADLDRIAAPSLVLQCSDDIIAPAAVGAYTAERLPHATFHQLEARGHCPNVSAPEETAGAMNEWLGGLYG